MKPLDDELFAHIKESLTEHEEAYIPGAWERFEKKDRKKLLWPWFTGLSSAAAVLLIGFILFYTEDKTQNNERQQQVGNITVKQNTDATADQVAGIPKPRTTVEKLKPETAGHKNMLAQKRNNGSEQNPVMVPVRISDAKKQPAPSAVQPAVSASEGLIAARDIVLAGSKKDMILTPGHTNVVTRVIADEEDSAKVNKTRSFQEFLDSEMKSKHAVAASKSSAKKNNKWEMGLMIAPSVGNAKKLNMGYGVSMGYALSDKVSISSGISYNEIAASKSVGGTSHTMDAPANMALVNDTKSLKSVDANLVGIDIPLGIKYYLSKKLYTNVGISAFAVLNQKQQNNYVQGSVEYAASADQTNSAGFKAFFQERAVSEPVPSGEIGGDKYLGFYNISFGFKQQISGSKAFSVEPFMKLPMKEFTKENLYLIGTGLRLKFDF